MLGILIILIICGYTEHNSGPKKNKSWNIFSLWHWNLSIAAHGFSKLSLLEAWNIQHMYITCLINETILSTVHNYIPNKYTKDPPNDKDPPRLNDHMKCLIKMKNEIFKMYLKDGRSNSDYENLQTTRNIITETINSSKNTFYGRHGNKLNDPYFIKNILVILQVLSMVKTWITNLWLILGKSKHF